MNFYQDLSHPVIIRLSQELDELLNQMNRLYKQQLSWSNPSPQKYSANREG